MDAADWYLNLALREWLARTPNSLGNSLVRGLTPVIRRGQVLPQPAGWLLEQKLPGDIQDLLKGKPPRLGVAYLRTEELYIFERRLPAAIRKFGSELDSSTVLPPDIQDDFRGPVDHLFEKRLLSVFARIDLSLPDDVLLADAQAFISNVRAEFSRIGGRQPYSEALHKLGRRYKARLKTFANIRLLPFIDLKQWCKEENATLTDERLAELLDLDETRLPETARYAALVLDNFVLRGWLIGPARNTIVKRS